MTVRFGKSSTDHNDTAGGLYLNARDVTVDGRSVGTVYGTDPSPYNAIRPTSYLFVSTDRALRWRSDRLESMRREIERKFA